MFIELHLIQNFAPSNLNRDDTNNPKDCIFGGTRRARISSQCLKRAIRSAPVFSATTAVPNAARTRFISRKIKAALVDAGWDEEKAGDYAVAFARAYSSKKETMDKDDPTRTMVMLYLSDSEIRYVVDAFLNDPAPQKEVVKRVVGELAKMTKGRTSAPDIALFGRMLADRPETNIDAACQVAHAISTHKASMEIDFFTAVDDLQTEEESGGAMMGTTGFNSATFYRYARMDWKQLVRNLDNDVELARCTVEAFLRASVEAVPTGKQNTFAAHNPPSFILAVVRDGSQGWSLANAFEQPVTARGEAGIVARSVEALDAYWERLTRVYGSQGVRAFALPVDPGLKLTALNDQQVGTLDELTAAVLAALPQE